MAIDVARVSFDRGRKYTRTVPQQGRVTLEAEENEQYTIEDTERLAELRDIIGPAGTPDDGYAITSAGGGDLTIGAGTMYVGGLRVFLDAPILYSDQPDWVDWDGDPAFTPVTTAASGNEHVVLELTEYDVTATEDPMLREVALGGPDGSARERIIQRVRRLATKASTCADATAGDAATWAQEGLVFDPATMRLDSASSLLVTWNGPLPDPDPCEPTSTGGYLGAENQVIRVQVAAADPAAKTFTLVWAWDNASALYAVTPGAGGAFVLDRAPVDDFHNPLSGQPVELLRAAADLNSSDGVTEGYVAELTGQISVLSAPYDPDTRTIVYPSSLPSEYLDTSATPQLYLRVWQEMRVGVAAGDTVALTGTGLSVTLTIPGGIAHPGDFWSIAVRPATPDTVLPDRFLRTPQPPDGPRIWACPLAVIAWKGGQFTLLDDCRVPFPPLTGLPTGTSSGCCTVSVEPAQADQLQKIIDKATAGRKVNDVTSRVTICLRPGRYLLTDPIRLGPGQGELHLEGCGEGAVLAAKAGSENNFPQGLIEIVRADAVRITGITFMLPLAGNTDQDPATGKNIAYEPDPRLAQLAQDRAVSIGIRAVTCQDLSVEDCVFNFGGFSLAAALPPGAVYTDAAATSGAAGSSGAAAKGAATGDTATVHIAAQYNDDTQVTHLRSTEFAVGIFTAGICGRTSVVDCRFTYTEFDQTDSGTRIRIGILSCPALLRDAKAKAKATKYATSMLDSLLVDATIRANWFQSLTVALVAVGGPGGIRVTDNTVRDCYGGIWLVAADTLNRLDLIGAYQASGVSVGTMASINDTISGTWLDPALMFVVAHGWTYPLPDAAASITGTAQTGPGTPPSPADWTKMFTARITGGAYPPTVNAVPEVNSPDAVVAATPAAATTPATGSPTADEVWFGRFAGSQAELIADGGPGQQTVRDAALTVEAIAVGIYVPATPTADVTVLVHGNIVTLAEPVRNFAVGTSSPAGTGPALLVVNDNPTTNVYTHDTAAGTSGTLIVDANEFTGQPTGPVVAVLLMSTVTVTGNVIRRLVRDGGHSINVIGVAGGAAITGNVLFGAATLPGRPYAPPLNDWAPFNTVN